MGPRLSPCGTSGVVAAAAVVVAAWAPGTAAAGQRIQAERMHVSHGAGHVVRDAGASGGRALLLDGAGTARASVRVRASSRLTVVVRARPCAGAPRLVVAVDGARVLTRRVTGRGWSAAAPAAALAAGRRRITVRLANPHRAHGCRRSLRVDRLDLAPVPKAAAKARWIPPPNTTWQWQLTTPVDLSVDAQLFDIDLFDNAASVVAALHARGRHVACYLDAGTLEPGRPDSGDYPAAVVGKELPDWPGEHWLDVRRLDVLGPLL
ncbi:MAG: endo alpha-1,4 polygalactosaminidase, partial [Solirubrobacteraceae bacterium]